MRSQKLRIRVLLGVWLIPFTAKGSTRRGETSSRLQTQLGRFGRGARASGHRLLWTGVVLFLWIALFYSSIFHTRIVSVTPHA